MHKLYRILLAGAMLAVASSTTMAAGLGAGGINGGVVANTVTVTPNDLSNSSLTLTASYTLDGTGSLATVTSPSLPATLDLGNLSSFTLTNGAGFTFSAASGTFSAFTVAGTKYLIGSLMGTASLGALSNPATLSFTFTQIGSNPVGGGFSLAVTAIPEPSSVALAGIGLAAAGLFGLRKRVTK